MEGAKWLFGIALTSLLMFPITGKNNHGSRSATAKPTSTRASEIAMDTTTAEENGLSTGDSTTTETGDGSSPTIEPVTATMATNCMNMYINPGKQVFLSSEAAEFSCTCESQATDDALCPLLTIDPLAADIVISRGSSSRGKNNCTTSLTITALPKPFTRRRIEVPISCSSDNSTMNDIIFFEKQLYGGMCNMDIDCLNMELECDQVTKTCRCYSDVPAYIKERGQCVPASRYNELCDYDEQCTTLDNNSKCSIDKLCTCKPNYWPRSNDDLNCTNSLSPWLLPNQAVIATSVVLGMMLISLTV